MPLQKGLSARPLAMAATPSSTLVRWRSIQAALRSPSLRPAQVASRRQSTPASMTPSASASQVLTSARSRPCVRNQLADGRQGVEVFDDHARVEHRLAAFHDQARHLSQRVGAGNRGVGRPDVFDHELVIEPLFGQHHAHLAHIRAGGGSDQFHEGSLPKRENVC
jgi:hypothetical protein